MQAIVIYKLSRDEVLKAIKEYVEKEMTYSQPKPKGDIVSIEIKDGAVEISFSEKEVEEISTTTD